MIRNKDIKTILELQKIAQSYSKEISRVFGTWQRMGAQIEAAMKPFYENMESIRKGMEHLSKINLVPHKEMLNNLRFMEEKINNFVYPTIKLPEITPSVPFMPNVKEDERLKQLIKESIIELEQELSEKREFEIRKLSKERKIKGFSRDEEGA